MCTSFQPGLQLPWCFTSVFCMQANQVMRFLTCSYYSNLLLPVQSLWRRSQTESLRTSNRSQHWLSVWMLPSVPDWCFIAPAPVLVWAFSAQILPYCPFKVIFQFVLSQLKNSCRKQTKLLILPPYEGLINQRCIRFAFSLRRQVDASSSGEASRGDIIHLVSLHRSRISHSWHLWCTISSP